LYGAGLAGLYEVRTSPSAYTFRKARDIVHRFGQRKIFSVLAEEVTSIYAIAIIVIVDIRISLGRVILDHPKFGYCINITNSFGEDGDALATSY
jgi:hypothetical protein